jgi:hypothetical protein
MQMRQDCSIDKCPGRAWFRKGKNVKVENFPRKDEVFFSVLNLIYFTN